MLVLDTSAVDPADRAEAFQSCVSGNCTTSVATFENDANLQAAMEVFELGQAKVFNIESTGMTLTRTPRMSRAMNECPIALALPMRNTNHLSRKRDDRSFGADDLILVDLSEPYVYGWGGHGASYAFHVEYDDLGVPMDTIAKASAELRRSPLYGLVRNHIKHVMMTAADLADSTAASQVGAASAELMYALIVSAAGDAQLVGDAMQSSTAARVQTWIQQHRRDQDLSPARIALENAISVRTLYQVFQELEISLEQYIIDQRLEGARAALTSAASSRRPIAAVAREWGFHNASFFSNRFRRAYGVTPSEWKSTVLSSS